MKDTFLYEGYKPKTSAKGNIYADIFLKPIVNGVPEFEQLKARSFSEELIKKLASIANNSTVTIDFDCTDIRINNIEISEI